MNKIKSISGIRIHNQLRDANGKKVLVKSLDYISHDKQLINGIECSFYDGIEIDKNNLSDLGFQDFKENSMKYRINDFISLVANLSSKSSIVLFITNMKLDNSESAYPVVNTQEITNIKCIHQLENLISSLSGKYIVR